MPGKKAHHPRDPKDSDTLGIRQSGRGRKSTGQTEGQFARDPKGSRGQYTGAGGSSLVKK